MAKEAYEIIVINDGSTDKSEETIKNHIQNTSKNIRLISQSNRGVARTRNKGLHEAQGDYILFVDADNYIEQDILGDCITKIKQNNLDVLICDFLEVRLSGRKIKRSLFIHSPNEHTIYTGNEILDRYYDYEGYSCMSFYRKVLFFEHNLFYPERIMCEDMNLVPKILFYAKQVMYSPVTLYYYIRRADSITMTSSLQKSTDMLEAVIELKNFGEEQNRNAQCNNYFARCYSHTLYFVIKGLANKGKNNAYTEKIRNIIEEEHLLPMSAVGAFKERFDKHIINFSMPLFLFWYRLKKGLFFR